MPPVDTQTRTPRPATADDVRALTDEHAIRFVRLWFTDILGQLKSFSIDAQEIHRAVERGVGFDGASITGFNAVEESDMVAVADPSTFAVLPWGPTERGVARVFCDIRTPEGAAYEGDPRHVLRRALRRMQELGFDGLEVSAELEYFLFAGARDPRPLDEGGYFDLTTLDAGSAVRRETALALEQLGMRIASSHHEVGPSQHELDLRPDDALKAADDCMTCRITVKEIALRHGWHATFMPKPLGSENGSGMHTHLALRADGRNAFSAPDEPYGLSSAARAFVAGQLRHARELSALIAPTVNSYKRLVPGYEAPLYAAWSSRNRSALARVPLHRPADDDAVRVELRGVDAACNPYLAFAVLLHAGLDGIEHGYELPEPMEQNLYYLSNDERRRLGVQQLPETLGEAVEAMADSELALRSLGEHIFDRYLEIKRREWEDYRVQVTRWELARYLAIL